MMPAAAIVACKRCKVKKLKCDDEPKVCKHCSRACAPCIQVDSRSRREYSRGYIEHLLGRIDSLNQLIRDSSRSESASVGGMSASISPANSASQGTFHGHDSVTSMARLIEAAVPDNCAHASLTAIGMEAARERQEFTAQATPATLPSKEVAELLFSSYFDGLHLLHPFLRRSTLIQELELAYSDEGMLSNSLAFRINMVFAIGAVSLFRAGLHDIPPMNYYITAMRSAGDALGLAGLEHIQALLLLLLFSLQHDIGIGRKWDLARVAMRICVENNFQKRNIRYTSLIDEQLRRRVFWACYIADRHSSSVLGRSFALQDKDISAELPIDADDDLLEAGNIEAQILRGPSEVSAQLRQIHLRQITSKIWIRLHNNSGQTDNESQPIIVTDILDELDEWRDSFPIILQARNTYEILHWRDLNYFRERLRCFRLLVLRMKKHPHDDGNENMKYLSQCQEAAAQVVSLYQAMQTSDKLILNWTCVHDMMSAGFTNLYCGIAQRNMISNGNSEACVWAEQASRIRNTTSAILKTLSFIATRWPTVKTHVQVFEVLAEHVVGSVRSASSGIHAPESTSAGVPVGSVESDGWDNSTNRYAEMWDSAMAAFLDEPLDLGHIDWGGIDWEAMQLFPDQEGQI